MLKFEAYTNSTIKADDLKQVRTPKVNDKAIF